MEGLIRKIVIGENPKDGMAYYVGMRVRDGEVSTILHNEKLMANTGTREYLIYIETDGGQVLWKKIHDTPVVIEYDLNF